MLDIFFFGFRAWPPDHTYYVYLVVHSLAWRLAAFGYAGAAAEAMYGVDLGSLAS